MAILRDPSDVIMKPCNSDWDLNLLTEITHLVSGLNEAQVLDVSLWKEFSEKQNDG